VTDHVDRPEAYPTLRNRASDVDAAEVVFAAREGVLGEDGGFFEAASDAPFAEAGGEVTILERAAALRR
jgi:hypothetical protein